MAGQNTMMMPEAQVKAGAPQGNSYQQKRQQIDKEVSSQGVLGEVQRSLQDPAKKAALERFMAQLDQAQSGMK